MDRGVGICLGGSYTQLGSHENRAEVVTNEILMPVFYTNQISVGLTMKDGSYALAGTLTPKGKNGEVDYDQKLIVFVMADVVPIRK
jgi:hypothetical protein